MKYILASLSILILGLLVGCATQPMPIEPSFYLLSTNKAPTVFLNEIAEEMKRNRYEVESLDLNVGLLVMQPRKFVILRGDARAYGEQKFQMRQEGGSVKVRISYVCQYANKTTDCNESDEFARAKIRRIERLLMATINRKLFKKRGEEKKKIKEI